MDAHEFIVWTRLVAAAVELARDGLGESVGDERTLARAAHSGNRSQSAEGNPEIDIPQIVLSAAEDLQITLRGTRFDRHSSHFVESDGWRGVIRDRIGNRSAFHGDDDLFAI
jgi:hypothetical protein